jgi:type IV pilus assembly protein PilC
MAIIEYEGQLASGNAISGSLEAADPEDAKEKLESMGIRVTTVAGSPRMQAVRPLSREDLLFFNQQLASLSQTGIALDEGLGILAKDLRRGRLRRVVAELADDIKRGIPLEDAIERRQGLFPPLYAEVLRTGVKNNQLGSTLCNLSAHMSMMQATRRVFWESAVYPIIILLVGFGVLTLFMTVVVPEYKLLVADVASFGWWDWNTGWMYNVELPLPTRMVFAASSHWPAILSTVGIVSLSLLLVFGGLRLFNVGKRLREILIMVVPGVWGVYLASLLARFSRAAALSAAAGHDLPVVLRLAAGATGHTGLVRDAEELSRRIEAGRPATEASKNAGLIPAILGYTAQVAGRRGRLASALAEMARSYDALARHRMAMLRHFLTPCLILLTAALLGLGILGIFGPLIGIINYMTG